MSFQFTRVKSSGSQARAAVPITDMQMMLKKPIPYNAFIEFILAFSSFLMISRGQINSSFQSLRQVSDQNGAPRQELRKIRRTVKQVDHLASELRRHLQKGSPRALLVTLGGSISRPFHLCLFLPDISQEPCPAPTRMSNAYLRRIHQTMLRHMVEPDTVPGHLSVLVALPPSHITGTDLRAPQDITSKRAKTVWRVAASSRQELEPCEMRSGHVVFSPPAGHSWVRVGGKVRGSACGDEDA
eukprot:gnl/Dysnectes_brevis/1935_a2222_1886.p1 GENE.gnl/Dysnectes_brevis/1935_a2222_1886~~gnl/Dysnectes_brevis/1935_a2222_1886.p1  ORF type:complete len:256 (+),score=45.72 gnl/Dysnectes_brevis/1935_a2222_1886:45-770(+)